MVKGNRLRSHFDHMLTHKNQRYTRNRMNNPQIRFFRSLLPKIDCFSWPKASNSSSFSKNTSIQNLEAAIIACFEYRSLVKQIRLKLFQCENYTKYNSSCYL